MGTVGIIATLDTKGSEAAFLKEQIESAGHSVLLLDSGMLHSPATEPDITRDEILSLAGVDDLEAYRKNGKAALQKAMAEGLKKIVVRLHKEGRIQAVLSVGGAQGSAMSTAAMQMLPIGFPKVMVSTIAGGSARFGDYVGNRDIVMIPSIADICGLNSITVPIFASGCGAVVGMMESAQRVQWNTKMPKVALTMAGVTTECVMRVKTILDDKGYETIVFHCNVVGAVVIDELAKKGELDGVIDITPHEIGGLLWEGLLKGDKSRFNNVYSSGIPVMTLPGGVDIILRGPVEELEAEMKDRVYYQHTPFHTHIRTTKEEMYQVGEYITKNHNRCKGKNVIMVPKDGYSQQNASGKVFYDTEANRGFIDAVHENKLDSVGYEERDMHMNDPEFAKEIVKVFEKLI